MTHSLTDETSRRIFLNHLSVLRYAARLDLESILVFEDDVEFQGILTHMNAAVRWLRQNTWDLCYLGYCQWPVMLTMPLHPNVVELWSPMALHAYAVHRRGWQKILHHLEVHRNSSWDVHIDRFYAGLPLRKVGVYPMVAFQAEEPALYCRAIDMMGVLGTFAPSFQVMCLFSEVFSLCTTVILGALLVSMVTKRFGLERKG
jgi:hypothetical protein